MHYWWWFGKMTDQYAEEKRWVFKFDLKEESEDKYLTKRGVMGVGCGRGWFYSQCGVRVVEVGEGFYSFQTSIPFRNRIKNWAKNCWMFFWVFVFFSVPFVSVGPVVLPQFGSHWFIWFELWNLEWMFVIHYTYPIQLCHPNISWWKVTTISWFPGLSSFEQQWTG